MLNPNSLTEENINSDHARVVEALKSKLIEAVWNAKIHYLDIFEEGDYMCAIAHLHLLTGKQAVALDNYLERLRKSPSLTREEIHLLDAFDLKVL